MPKSSSLSTLVPSFYPGFDKVDGVFSDFDFRADFYKDFFALPSQTNYVTETFFTPGYNNHDSPALDVLSSFGIKQVNCCLEENFTN